MNSTQIKILEVCTKEITELFTLREIARRLNLYPSQVHKAIKPLLNQKIILESPQKFLYLNYRKNHELLSYIESLRTEEIVKKYKELQMFVQEVKEKIKEHSFVLLLFGSAVNTNKPRDIDILLIVENKEKVEFHEKFLSNIVSKYTLPIEERVISFESVYEMLLKREEKNLMNEIINKHIILSGGELFYLLITRARK